MNKDQYKLIIKFACMPVGTRDSLLELVDEHFKLKEDYERLKKRETPKHPEMMRVKEYDGYNIGFCQCGAVLDTSMIEDEINYCHVCGQKIKWECEDV